MIRTGLILDRKWLWYHTMPIARMPCMRMLRAKYESDEWTYLNHAVLMSQRECEVENGESMNVNYYRMHNRSNNAMPLSSPIMCHEKNAYVNGTSYCQWPTSMKWFGCRRYESELGCVRLMIMECKVSKDVSLDGIVSVVWVRSEKE